MGGIGTSGASGDQDEEFGQVGVTAAGLNYELVLPEATESDD